jgi:pyruvate,water dikinase
MDMEWAKDGITGDMFIVQARPETVQSRKREASAFRSYHIKSKGERLVTGLSIGDAIVAGKVCLIDDVKDIGRFVDGSILVTQMTDPDWVPVMKRAAHRCCMISRRSPSPAPRATRATSIVVPPTSR